ncbi:MAG TPA: chromosomal replication initiator protein DnaA [Bacteroidetes bacterium]|nr:chromosomal replication initiator protein DnaA [Bacteroidota bacterium]HEX05129.1 chromosomal replication initiator protein DnaA [Bacteroidota bacterium]
MTVSARRLLTEPTPQEGTGEADIAWRPILDDLQQSLPSQAYSTWFEPLKAFQSNGETLVVEVPSRFYFEWIEGHYAKLLDRVIEERLGNSSALQYTLASTSGADYEAEPVPASNLVKVNGDGGVAHTNGVGSANGLNPRYTFTQFIEGPPNRFARAASLAVAKSPGKTTYDPLLIYGGVGLGKTHLLQAIGNAVQQNNPSMKVRYISSEQFTKEFVEAIKTNRGDQFSARYHSVDLLLMDDVQFLVGRDRTLLEFFHIFNNLYQAGKQIVLSSDKPPKELNGLDERLVSRFGWGLVCDIGPPDFDTRVAIIETLAEHEGFILPKEITEYLALRFTKNVREMQGALIRLMAHASLTGMDISLELAKKALHDLINNQERRISVDQVQQVVAAHYQVAPDLLLAKIRTQPIARARMVAMALTLRLCHFSLKQVGANFGGRDHTTVLHARDRVNEWIEGDDVFASEISGLIRRIESEDE